MENRIDKVITLEDNSKYMILDQGNYNGKSYYLTSKLDENGNLTDGFSILENNNEVVSTVEDTKLLNALIDYFKKRFEVISS